MAVVETVHQTESGAILAFTRHVVVKVHRDGTSEDALRARLNWAAHPDLAGVLVPPLTTSIEHILGRPVTCWPRVDTLDPDDEPSIPWSEAATLLARLHLIGRTLLATPGTPVTSGHPQAGAVARVHRAVGRVEQALASTPHLASLNLLNRVGHALASELAGTATDPGRLTLIHGDFHAGQMGRTRAADWHLIDIDDLGVGDPAWDLARPAGLWAAGLLPDEDWEGFLDAYRSARGPGVPASGDPWLELDLPARCAVFVTTVRYLLRQARTSPTTADDDAAAALLLDVTSRLAH